MSTLTSSGPPTRSHSFYATYTPSLLLSLPPIAFLLLLNRPWLSPPPSPTLLSLILSPILIFYLLMSFLSPFFRPIRYYFRLLTFLSGLAVCSTFGVVISVLMTLVGRSKDINFVVARSFWGLVAPLVGVRFRVEGEENLGQKGGQVVLGNHQSMVDILYLGRIFPKSCTIMAKKELKYTPLLGQFMSLSHAVWVNRSSRASAVAVLKGVVESLKRKNLSLFIFPEGTRSASSTPTLLPFKKGPFHLAVESQLPIVPIVCENYYRIYSSSEKRFDGGEIVIKVLPPIETKGLKPGDAEDVNGLLEKTRGVMLKALEELGRKREEEERLRGIFKGESEAEEREPLVSSGEEEGVGEETATEEVLENAAEQRES